MENENKVEEEIKKENNLSPAMSIIIVVVLIIGAFVYTAQFKSPEASSDSARLDQQQKNFTLQNLVELPEKWGDM